MATANLSRKTGVVRKVPQPVLNLLTQINQIVGDDVHKLFKYAQEKKFAIPAIVCSGKEQVGKKSGRDE